MFLNCLFAHSWDWSRESGKKQTFLFPFYTNSSCIECFHSRGQQLCRFIGTKERVCIRKEFNSHRIGLGHQHGRHFIVLGHQYGHHFIVLGHQYGCHDVMWKHSIPVLTDLCCFLSIIHWESWVNLSCSEHFRFIVRLWPPFLTHCL